MLEILIATETTGPTTCRISDFRDKDGQHFRCPALQETDRVLHVAVSVQAPDSARPVTAGRIMPLAQNTP